MRERVAVALVIVLVTLFGYLIFPGHTYLQSDTQVYVPMLERLYDASVLQRDFMVERPHMAFTIYDEVSVSLRRLTGLGFREILAGQQLLFRALELLGVFLIVNSFGIGRWMSLAAMAIFSFGATIWGPTVLTIEYEPIPRAFALALIFLAVGLEARGWPLAAGSAAAVAFLYHGTTTLPYWICYACLVLWPAERPVRRHRLLGVVPLIVVAAVLGVLSLLQPGRAQPLLHFEQIAPWWEQVLRLRSTYVWVSLWFPRWGWHYAVLTAVCGVGFWRLRKLANPDLRVFLVGLPALGVLSLPLSYIMLEVLKSSLAPQLQPMRALLFVAAVASLVAAVAGMRAAQARRWLEALPWLAVAIAIPFTSRTPAGVLPRAADVQELSQWARASTPRDAVFLFPDAGRDLYPGVFRAEALRAVYVDWKSGGQANYQRDVAAEWWKRWQFIRPDRYRPGDPRRYHSLGIDYVVLRQSHRSPAPPPVFENASYAAYRLR